MTIIFRCSPTNSSSCPGKYFCRIVDQAMNTVCCPLILMPSEKANTPLPPIFVERNTLLPLIFAKQPNEPLIMGFNQPSIAKATNNIPIIPCNSSK